MVDASKGAAIASKAQGAAKGAQDTTFFDRLAKLRKKREEKDRKEKKERRKKGDEPSQNFTIGGALRDLLGAAFEVEL